MKDLRSLQPMSSYEVPKYPTLDETKNDTKLLRKLPSRWKNNVAVIACVGMLTFGMFAGCTVGSDTTENWWTHHGGANMLPRYVTCPVGPEIPLIWSSIYDDLQISFHHGGEGGAPTYLVQLTENEMRAIIQARLEQFDIALTEYESNDTISLWHRLFSVEKYNSTHNVGVVFLPFVEIGDDAIQDIRAQFEGINDMFLGIFYSGSQRMTRSPEWHEYDTLRQILRYQIIEQADNFITEVQARGIIEE